MRRDRGFVLVNALIVVAAVSALSVGVLRDAAAGTERVQALRDGDRAAAALDAGAALAARLLVEDARSGATDHADEAWALDGVTYDLGGAALSLDAADLQGRFNLNLLLEPGAEPLDAVFAALAEEAGVEADVTAAILAHYGAARALAAGPPPVVPGLDYAADEIALAGELALVVGVAPEALEPLAERVSFLPREAGVNLNTAGEEVVTALLGEDDGWPTFEAARPFAALPEALAAVEAAFGTPAAERLDTLPVGVGSNWFAYDLRAQVDAAAAAAHLRVRRTEAPPAIHVVLRRPEDP